jgi:hypothetical protein
VEDTTISDKERLAVLEGRPLRYVFGPKGEKVTEDCRKLHVEELMFLHASTGD